MSKRALVENNPEGLGPARLGLMPSYDSRQPAATPMNPYAQSNQGLGGMGYSGATPTTRPPGGGGSAGGGGGQFEGLGGVMGSYIGGVVGDTQGGQSQSTSASRPMYDPLQEQAIGQQLGREAGREGFREDVAGQMLGYLQPRPPGTEGSAGLPNSYWQSRLRVGQNEVNQGYQRGMAKLEEDLRTGRINHSRYEIEKRKLDREREGRLGSARAGVQREQLEQSEQASLARAQQLLGLYGAVPGDMALPSPGQESEAQATGTTPGQQGTMGSGASVVGGGGDVSSSIQQGVEAARAAGYTNFDDLKTRNPGLIPSLFPGYNEG